MKDTAVKDFSLLRCFLPCYKGQDVVLLCVSQPSTFVVD